MPLSELGMSASRAYVQKPGSCTQAVRNQSWPLNHARTLFPNRADYESGEFSHLIESDLWPASQCCNAESPRHTNYRFGWQGNLSISLGLTTSQGGYKC